MNTPLVATTVLGMSLAFCATQQAEKRNVMVAVVAHPDDEAAIAQLLVKYGKTNKVYVIIATDGRYGVKPGFPTGDALVKLRQAESECACAALGTQPPIFLGFTDGFDTTDQTKDGVRAYFERSTQLKRVLAEKLEDLNPDAIVTFGPDGDTGHSDHRMVSNMTTEVILSKGWVERFPLYYLGWQQKDDEKLKKSIGLGLNTVASQYLNVSIGFTEEEERTAMLSLQCYKSQLTAEEAAQWAAQEKEDASNTFYFRQLTVSGKRKTEF
jgi:LmbE family N-acetylglucosaminyl deacetylase